MAIAWNQSAFVVAGGTNITGAVVANNITVASSRIFKKLTVVLGDGNANDNGLLDSFSGAIGWAIYSDNGGKPGTLLFSGTDAAPALIDTGVQSDLGGDIFNVDLALGDIALGTGNYWVAIHEGGWGAADDGTPVQWMWNPAGSGWGLVQGGPVGSPAVWTSDLHDSAFSLDGEAVWDKSDPTAAGGVDLSQARGAASSFSLTAGAFMGGATVYLTDGVVNDNGQLDSFSGNLYWSVYSNVGGKPGTGTWASSKAISIVMTDTGLQSASGADIVRVDFAFDRLTQLSAGDYFLVLHEGSDAATPFDGSSIYWSFNATGTGPDTLSSSVVGGTVQWTATGGDTSFQMWESVISLVDSYYGNLYEDTSVSINVQQFLWTSTDDYTIAITGSPARGTATVDDNGTAGDATDDFIRYTPDANAVGTDQFSYTVTSGTASKTGRVGVNIVGTNDAPTVSNFADDAALWVPVNNYALLDTGTRVAVTDIDSSDFKLGALNVSITGGGVPGEDRIYFAPCDRVQLIGSDIYVGGTKIGTFASNGGATTILFGSGATPARVAEALHGLAYANTSANPTPGTRTITYTMVDGDLAANGGTDTTVWTSTVNVVALDASGIANADARALNEGQKVNLFVTANDSDANGPLQVVSINGVPISSGGSVTLPSGAVVWLLANGKLQYDTNGAFDYLVSAATGAAHGAASNAVDRFVYALPDGSTAMVSVTVNGVDGTDGRLGGTVGNDALTGTTGNDIFLLQAGGTDSASGGAGNDSFYFGRNLAAGDIVNGGDGNDTLLLQGVYGTLGPAFVLGADMLNNIEMLVLMPGDNSSYGAAPGTETFYKLQLSDAALAAGRTLTVQGSKLGSNEALRFDGSAETNGHLRLVGGSGHDNLTGGALADWISGGGGRDDLNGGAGADTFVFRDGDSVRLFNTDIIWDLAPNDLIDLSAIDANTLVAGDQAFTFLGYGAFTGVAGQLRVNYDYMGVFAQWRIEGDMDGDGVADLVIEVGSDMTLAGFHFVL
jgi:hypothetical protein